MYGFYSFYYIHYMELTKEIKAKLSPYAKTFEAKYGNIKDGITLYNCSLCAMSGNEKIGLDIDLGVIHDTTIPESRRLHCTGLVLIDDAGNFTFKYRKEHFYLSTQGANRYKKAKTFEELCKVMDDLYHQHLKAYLKMRQDETLRHIDKLPG